MEKVILIGGGGHCKVVIDIIQSEGRLEIAGILDTNKDGVLGIDVIGEDKDLPKFFLDGIKNAVICVGGLSNPKIRERIYKNLKEIGYKLPILKHSKSVVSKHALIREGTCIMAGVVINPGAEVSEICIVNTSAVIEHDCVLGKNVNVCPGAIVLGGSKVGENTLIGAGAIIKQGMMVGKNSLVGAGSVVIKDVKDDILTYGNPAAEVRNIGKKR